MARIGGKNGSPCHNGIFTLQQHIKAIRLPEAQPPKKAPPKKDPNASPPNEDVCTLYCPHLKHKCQKVHNACSKWPKAIREIEGLLKEISRLEKLLPEG